MFERKPLADCENNSFVRAMSDVYTILRMTEARSYTRGNYNNKASRASYKRFYEWYRRIPIPQKLQDLLTQPMVLRIVEMLYVPEKLGIASSRLVNNFTSGSGAFLYPRK